MRGEIKAEYLKKLIVDDFNRPFIFISYAHEDKNLVYPIILKLLEDNYRVWFDGGIHGGSKWSDVLATRIEKCCYFVAFITGNYINSGPCTDELHWAGSNEKNRVLVYLENVSLPAGLKMQENRNQYIPWYESDSKEDAYKMLCESDGIEAALGRDGGPELERILKEIKERFLNGKGISVLNVPTGRMSYGLPFDFKQLKKPLVAAIGVLLVLGILSFFFFRSATPFAGGPGGGRPSQSSQVPDSVSEEPTPSPEPSRPSADQVSLVSITEPVEAVNFSVKEDVSNTLGITYRNAVVIGADWGAAAYVRYYVADYDLIQGSFSVPDNAGQEMKGKLTVYLDDNEDDPLPGYDRLDLNRTALEQSFEFDLSDANFITFYLDTEGTGMYSWSGVMFTDTYFYQDAANAPSQSNNTGQSDSSAELKLTSVKSPVAAENFSIWEDVTNTLGVTYRDAVVIGADWGRLAYVRYYVADYDLIQGSFSVPNDAGQEMKGKLTVYLDDNEDDPLPGYDRLDLNRTALEQSFEFDLSDANFITFYLDTEGTGMYSWSGVMFTDCVLVQ